MSDDQGFRGFVFPAATVRELVDRLEVAGPTAEVHVHIHGHEAFLEVEVPGLPTAATPMNESHPCPPQCG